VQRHHFFDYRIYEDVNNDGEVDTVYRGAQPFTRGSYDSLLDRSKHFGEYPEVFKEADKDFKIQLDRFKDLLNRE
jgi:hypothetical protein